MKCMLCEEYFEKDELITSQAKFSLDDGREKIIDIYLCPDCLVETATTKGAKLKKKFKSDAFKEQLKEWRII